MPFKRIHTFRADTLILHDFLQLQSKFINPLNKEHHIGRRHEGIQQHARSAVHMQKVGKRK